MWVMRLYNWLSAIVLAGICAGAGSAEDIAPMAGKPLAGKKVFRKCMACHQIGPSAVHGIGPVLNGIIGRKAGTLEGFTYSLAMTKSGAQRLLQGLVWTDETLDAYLASPRKYIRSNKMAFVGLRKPQQRRDVIAYLRRFGADGSVLKRTNQNTRMAPR